MHRAHSMFRSCTIAMTAGFLFTCAGLRESIHLGADGSPIYEFWVEEDPPWECSRRRCLILENEDDSPVQVSINDNVAIIHGGIGPRFIPPRATAYALIPSSAPSRHTLTYTVFDHFRLPGDDHVVLPSPVALAMCRRTFTLREWREATVVSLGGIEALFGCSSGGR